MSLSKRSVEDAQSLMSTKQPISEVTPSVLTEEQLMRFGNYGGADVKDKAAYLAKKGLIGASQLIMDNPNISTTEGLTNSQADWKTSAFGKMLMQARKLGIKDPTQVANNKEALMGTLDPRIKEAMNHPTFNQIHPNWWSTFNSVLKDQYDNETALPKPDLIAKK